MTADALDRFLIGELTHPVDPRLVAFVRAIVGERRPLGVLFYGSGLRAFDADGLFDFYILLDSLEDWPQSAPLRLGNALLPPNVHYVERDGLRAKVALLTLDQFLARSRPDSRDTTIWARFCQPVRLVWVRDERAADRILAAIRGCVMTAAGWAARLGEGPMTAESWWSGLFIRTYGVELRVETPERARVLMADGEARYAALLPLAWRAAGLAFDRDGPALTPLVTPERARRRWARIARRGRMLNVARLLKAAFTFEGGAAYLAWKILRHGGPDLRLSPFEARHPLLCLPRLLWRARTVLLRRRK
ncbi:hypothetical protein [Acidomonas methanolica]|uniref:Uncharacterized protein n=2 Tax=Acidomonas methanolica TaxID=437 RepID=A0A023D384_ACIMT|nr:hypothetical protein [Acidomonas methanolica]MBU2654519.1 hypothetical protein [Acidomonas methanolica]TCS28322.1 hypothetical protein EDC31_10993 [Acidomonas methanolica]GAJ28544.1 hypothetical protein Amme_031_006 [Acidomonas methanolica NBRC 104435]GEK99039.1 hypothetical protein AME01nite_15380 [Acidomonas methanolica NBRC 104435]